MTHEELVARLERERVSYPDEVEGERYPAHLPPQPRRPVSAMEAARHRKQLATALNGQDNA